MKRCVCCPCVRVTARTADASTRDANTSRRMVMVKSPGAFYARRGCIMNTRDLVTCGAADAASMVLVRLVRGGPALGAPCGRADSAGEGRPDRVHPGDGDVAGHAAARVHRQAAGSAQEPRLRLRVGDHAEAELPEDARVLRLLRLAFVGELDVDARQDPAHLS